MKILIVTSLVMVFLSSSLNAQPKRFFVKANILNVRLSPGKSCPVTNRVYRGDVITVLQIKGQWARISKYYDSSSERKEFPQIKTSTVARWVVYRFLTKTKPSGPKQPDFQEDLIDSRIKGVPKVGEGGLTRRDVIISRTYAAKLLKTGVCAAIDYGDKSVSKRNTYFVVCKGEIKSRFFLP